MIFDNPSFFYSRKDSIQGNMNTAISKTFPGLYEHMQSIPKPNVKFLYGTAGFRMHYDMLPSVFICVGIIGVLRSQYLKKVETFFVAYL